MVGFSQGILLVRKAKENAFSFDFARGPRSPTTTVLFSPTKSGLGLFDAQDAAITPLGEGSMGRQAAHLDAKVATGH